MTRKLPPLSALRAFEAAARNGRMTLAANELSVTPGAISRQVRLLEESLGTELFEGAKNDPKLTSAGQLLLPALSSAFGQIEEAVRSIKNESNRTVDVLCYGTFAMKWLIPRLYRFHELHADVEVRLVTTGQASESNRFDLVIGIDEVKASDAGNAIVLFAEQLGPVLSPSLLKVRKIRSSKDLNQYPRLHTRTRMNAWSMWEAIAADAFAPVELAPQVFEHYYFTLEAAVGGLGVCVAPWHLVAEEVQSARLVAPLGFKESGYRYVAKQYQHSNRNQAKRVFCDWLKHEAEQMSLPG